MTVVLLVIGAFACGVLAFACVAGLVTHAPDEPIPLSALAVPMQLEATRDSPWLVDERGSLLNTAHLRVLTVQAHQVVGEWAEAPSFDAESLVAVVTCASPAEAERALVQLSHLLGAQPIASVSTERKAPDA